MKKIISGILIGIVVFCIFSGCIQSNDATPQGTQYYSISKYEDHAGYGKYWTVTDIETGKKYIVCRYDRGVGIAPLN